MQRPASHALGLDVCETQRFKKAALPRRDIVSDPPFIIAFVLPFLSRCRTPPPSRRGRSSGAMIADADDAAAQAEMKEILSPASAKRAMSTEGMGSLETLLEKIEDGTLDTTFLISHRLPLEQAAEGYKNFKEQQNEWTKVILKPGMEN